MIWLPIPLTTWPVHSQAVVVVRAKGRRVDEQAPDAIAPGAPAGRLRPWSAAAGGHGAGLGSAWHEGRVADHRDVVVAGAGQEQDDVVVDERDRALVRVEGDRVVPVGRRDVDQRALVEDRPLDLVAGPGRPTGRRGVRVVGIEVVDRVLPPLHPGLVGLVAGRAGLDRVGDRSERREDADRRLLLDRLVDPGRCGVGRADGVGGGRRAARRAGRRRTADRAETEEPGQDDPGQGSGGAPEQVGLDRSAAYLSRSAALTSAAWAAARRATGTRNGEHDT